MKLDKELFDKAPDPMSKDMFYRVCHISKKTALYLLMSGKVRSENTGKATHSWLISKEAILKYADEYASDEISFKPPENYYSDGLDSFSAPTSYYLDMDERTLKAAREYYLDILGRDGGVLTTPEISRITGYNESTVCRWIKHKKLRILLRIGRKSRIPHQYFMDFLLSDTYNNIQAKSKNHKRAILSIMTRVQS